MHASSAASSLLGHEVVVTVTGLPAGAEASLELTVDRLFSSVSSSDPTCSVSGSTAICRLQGTGDDVRLVFQVTSLMEATVTVRVTGTDDPNPDNDVTVLRLTR